MRQHLLRVTRGAKAFESLIDAIRQAGERVGWLELEVGDPEPLETGLRQAADLGVLRAVAVGGRRSIAVKPLRGAAVMKDLLREHFRGCALVLIRGELDDPAPLRLEPRGEGWLLQATGEPDRELSTASLITALRKPRLLNQAALS